MGEGGVVGDEKLGNRKHMKRDINRHKRTSTVYSMMQKTVQPFPLLSRSPGLACNLIESKGWGRFGDLM